MASDALYGKASHLPYDITTKQKELETKRKIAEAMAAAAMRDVPTLTDTGVYKINNWGGQAAKAISAGFARRNLDDVAEEEQKVAADLNKRTADEFSKYYDTATPSVRNRPDMTLTGMTDKLDEQDIPRTNQFVPGDPKRALAEAMTSQIPRVQAFAEEERKQQQKMAQMLFEHGDKWDPQTVKNWGAQYGVDTPANMQPAVKAHVGTDLATFTQGPNVVKKEPLQTYSQNTVNMFGTDVPGQITDLTKKQSVFANPTSIPEYKGAGTMYEEASKDFVKQLSTGKGKALEAVDQIPILQGAYSLIDKVNMGTPLSELMQSGQQILKGLGLNDDEIGKISSTQAYFAAVSNGAMKIAERLRPASDTDLKQAKAMVGAYGASDPRAAKAAISVAMSGYHNDIITHQQNVGRIPEMTKVKGLENFGIFAPTYEVPFTTGPDGLGPYGLVIDPKTNRVRTNLLNPESMATGQPPTGQPINPTPRRIKVDKEGKVIQ